MGSECMCAVQVGARKAETQRCCAKKNSNGCGMDVGVKNGRVVGVRGRVTDRVNKGRLGPKGLNG